VTVVTAAGTLVTTVRDIEPAIVRSLPLADVVIHRRANVD
jgi:hypothetical protein